MLEEGSLFGLEFVSLVVLVEILGMGGRLVKISKVNLELIIDIGESFVEIKIVI